MQLGGISLQVDPCTMNIPAFHKFVSSRWLYALYAFTSTLETQWRPTTIHTRLATDLFRSLRKIAVRTNFFLARSTIDEFLPSFPAFLLLRIFACSTNMIIVVSQQEKVARCSLVKRGEPWEEWYSWYLWDQVLEDIIFFLFNRSGKAKILCCDISRFFECEIRLTLCSYRNKKMCRWKLSKIWYQFGEFRLCTDRWDF